MLVVPPCCEYPIQLHLYWCFCSVQAQLENLQATPSSDHTLSTVYPNEPLDKGKDGRTLGRLSPQLKETTGQQDVAKADHKSVSLIARASQNCTVIGAVQFTRLHDAVAAD